MAGDIRRRRSVSPGPDFAEEHYQDQERPCRAKPFGILAKYISAKSEVDAVKMHETYIYLNGLTTEDLKDLLKDIKVYHRLEKGPNADFREDITVIVEDELNKLRKLKSNIGSIYEAAMERREDVNKALARDAQSIFKGKTVE